MFDRRGARVIKQMPGGCHRVLNSTCHSPGGVSAPPAEGLCAPPRPGPAPLLAPRGGEAGRQGEACGLWGLSRAGPFSGSAARRTAFNSELLTI